MSDVTASALGDAVRSRYTLERELGRGGMATVYLARDLRHDRWVALKVLRPELATALGPERFFREIRLTARLQHPHILTVLDSGESAGRLWFTMPFVDGESLRSLLARERQLPIHVALRIARDAAEALHYAHQHGIIHRDIKPENLLLTTDRSTLVADFGLARSCTEAARDLTEAGIAVGTPVYMSPEHAGGAPGLDSRTDIYSLGCVLYEMLTGDPPFSGRSTAAILARKLVESAPSIRVVRDTVPESVEDVVMQSLERVPADRFPTMSAFAEALEAAAAVDGRGGRRPEHRAGLLLGGILLALLLAFAAQRWLGPEGPSGVDPDLVAVAPFDVLEPALQLWHEGLVDVLSRDLDGAGPLRSVSPTVTLRQWSGKADRTSAETLGRRTGAGLVLFGTILRKGPDSVSLRATVLDRLRPSVESGFEITGEEARMGELADSLGVAVLRALGQERPVGSKRRVTMGSRSLTGLKEFLRGEQFYRRGLWDSALVHYDRSIEADSTFGLSLLRMARVLQWGPATSDAYSKADQYEHRAIRFNRGLAPRDSLFLLSDSLALDAQDHESALVSSSFRSEALLEAAVRRYPDDPELWYELGEFRFHWGLPLGHLPAPALEAFDRAIATDSGFAPAYVHTVELAMQLHRPDLARRYARAYTALAPGDPAAPELRLVTLIFDSGGVGAPAVKRAITAASALALARTANDHLQWWADSEETSIVLLRELLAGRHDPAGATANVADSLLWPQRLASALAFRGHLHDAARVNRRLLIHPDLSSFSSIYDPFLELALHGTLPDSESQGSFELALPPSADWGESPPIFALPRFLSGLPWWFARGDSVAVARFGQRAARAARDTTSPLGSLRGAYLAKAAIGYLALLRGDSATAVRLFQANPDTLCLVSNCFYEKLTLARLLAARGEPEHAAKLLDEWTWAREHVPSAVLAILERGRIAERLGDRSTASDRYQFVADLWRRADPELQGFVTEARKGLARTGAPSR